MDKTLAARLSRIRSAMKTAPKSAAAGSRAAPPPSGGPSSGMQATAAPQGSVPASRSASFGAEWEDRGPFIRSRRVLSPRVYPSAESLSPALAVFCPCSERAFPELAPLPLSRLLFFDLETTGLSGGAGTVAFLAAFGRFTAGAGRARLSISQHLLLDYPGEGELIELLRREFEGEDEEPVLVSYNGRSFDMQILRTRCLMNAVVPPDPPHLDLVYAARRLWRRSLENCSLSTVEREALGVDRGEDLPGSEAPDAWFDFLKRGETDRLLRICDHNLSDLEGLAALALRLDEVARDPLAAVKEESRAPIDCEGVALRYRAAAKASEASRGAAAIIPLARALLEYAADARSPRASFFLAADLAASGDQERARSLRSFVARGPWPSSFPPPSAGLRAAAFRLLALDASRRSGDRGAALAVLDEGLSVADLPDGARAMLAALRDRLSAV